MVPLHRLAAPALAFLFLFGSCDRVDSPQEPDLPIQLDLKFGVWTDSAQAARDSLRQDHPHLGTITVGDTLWVRVRPVGDSLPIRSVDAFFAGSWKSVPLPVFFPVSWTDSGLQKVKVALFTDDDQFFDSLTVRVTNGSPRLRLPTLPGDGSLRVRPDESSSLFVAFQDDGRVDSLRWDLDGDGTLDTSTAATDTLRARWTLERILRARSHPFLRVVARDEDGNTAMDSLRLALEVPPPTLTLAGPDTVSIGDTLRFTATTSGFAPLGPVLWQDGTSGNAWQATAPRVDTILTARAIVRDSMGGADTAERRVVVLRDPPKLELGPDSTIAWGGTWRAIAARASDGTGTIVSTDWDWNGDGTWDTTATGFVTPLHRFRADTGRVVVRARVTDDDGNQATDSLGLRLDPAPWNVVLATPPNSGRLTDIVVKLAWIDSMSAGTTVRWTSNEGLDSTRLGRSSGDSIVIQGRLVDTLRLTAELTSPSGTRTTRTIAVILDPLPEGPEIFLTGPDTVSWGDSIQVVAETVTNGSPATVFWWNQSIGSFGRTVAPSKDTVLQLRARILDNLGRADSAVHTVVVVRDAPVADAGADLAVHAGRSLRLSGSAIQRFGSIVSWGWDLDNDGIFRTSTSSAGIDTTWETAGSRTVVLRVQDDDGNIDLDTLLLRVTDSVPTLRIGPFPSLAKRDTLVLLATVSDPDGDSLLAQWVVDGDTTAGAVRRVAFDSVGIHVVRAILRSFTPAGTLLATVTRTDTILVVADPPKLELGRDSTIPWGGTWRASGATASDSTGSIASTEWDWDGNGTWDTTVVGFSAPLHRFQGDTGRVLVRARITDDDNNRVIDSLALRVDPNPWSVSLTAPANSPRLTGIVAKLSWTDSARTGSTVRWTSNEGLDTTRSASSDADSVIVQGRLADTLRLTARLTSASGAVATRTVSIVLDPLSQGPKVQVFGPDSVSWNDTIDLAAETIGDVSPGDVAWWNQTTGLSATAYAPSNDTTLSFKVRITDNLGRRDSATKTVRVVRDAPVADAGTDVSVHAGVPVRLSGAATQRFGTIVSWGWDLDNDGVFRTSTSSAGIDTTWETVGPRTVVLRVRDDDGNNDLDTLVVTVSDAAPSLALDIPASVRAPGTAALVATAADPDGDSLAVSWVVDGDTLEGATRQASFSRGGPNAVFAIVRSYTRSRGTFLAETIDSGSVLVTSSLSVDLVAPDTIWADTLVSSSSLQAIVEAPMGVDSILWSFDNGSEWTVGSPSGSQTWIPEGLGPKTVIVRAVDRFGSSSSDTAIVVHLEDRPVVTLPDSLTIAIGTRSSSIPLTASVRFGGISSVRWRWTDIDSARAVDQTPTGGMTVSSPLAALFPPGRFVVRVAVSDERNNVTEDSVVVSSVGLRVRFKVAPDSVATGSNLHAEGAFDAWPSDSAVETGFVFDGTEYADRSVLDMRPPEGGIHPLTFWASFVGSQSRTSALRQVQVVYDPPAIQTFADDTIAEGTSPDLSFTATRRLGGIDAWVWDLSGATGTDNVRLGFATHSNDQGGTLSPVPPFLGGYRPVGYGVIGDGGDTTWVVRSFLVAGPPLAVNDTLGVAGRDAIDVTCEVGTDCDITDNLLLGNDQIGAGLEGSPELVSALDGATVGSNTDGTFVRLPAPSTSGVKTFRYVISNGYLQDTGTVRITIYERTDSAWLDLKGNPIGKAFVMTDGIGEWTPPESDWNKLLLNSETTNKKAILLREYPKVTGSRMVTRNRPVGGFDSIANLGDDLLAIDPLLGFRLAYGESDWMKGEEETLNLVFQVGTSRADGLGIPGQIRWTDLTIPITFQRQVVTSVVPDPKMTDLRPTYDCQGIASFEYVFQVAAVKNPHEGDFIRFGIQDLPATNGGMGYQDGDIQGTFTDVSGKPLGISFKRDELDSLVGILPTVGGTLTVRYTIKGLLDGNDPPKGSVNMGWFPAGGNSKATHLRTSKDGAFLLGSACKLQ